MIGIVRIRGRININGKVEDTLQMLGLKKKHSFTIIDETNRSAVGMLRKVKDFVTYGEIDDDYAKKILAGAKSKGLNPPRKGFKYSTRRSGKKGELGQREDLKELLERMI